MFQKYLTISEFAKLRNVSIGSLRYYEQLKILVPARIDPKTKYRYYLPEQLVTLDTILLCIELDIPLKDLKNYVDENGYLDQKEILTTGKKAMQKKISEMQMKLEITQYSLDSMERNQKYSSYTGVYRRKMEERFLLRVPLRESWQNMDQKWQLPMELFREAEEKHMSPVFSPGIILDYEQDAPKCSFYLQVLHPAEQDNRVIRLPEADYLCLQVDLTLQTDIEQLLEENFPTEKPKMAIIVNMMQTKLHFDSMRSEIQVLAEGRGIE